MSSDSARSSYRNNVVLHTLIVLMFFIVAGLMCRGFYSLHYEVGMTHMQK